jgi:DNA polymerase-3 subunit delta
MPKLTISELDRELRDKNIAPAYLIYGPEGYLAQTALSRIKACAARIGGAEVEPDRFSGRTHDISDMIACAGTLPMWSKFRLVIVSEADAIKEAGTLEAYLKRPSRTSSIVFMAEKADGRTKFVQLFSQKGTTVECKAPYEDKLPDWVRMEASNLGKNISISAAQLVAELAGPGLGELRSALDKIILYIGKKAAIEPADVETVLTDTGRRSVFEFADAVGRGDLPRAVKLLKKLTEFGESEVMILTMLARHWRILLKVREAMAAGSADKYALGKLVGVNPFFMDNYIAQARRFNGQQLKAGFKKIYLADKALKSSKHPKIAVLQKCIGELIR